jgi:hypothetical protein
MKLYAATSGRRRRALRRLFLFAGIVAAPAYGVVTAAESRGQDDPGIRILKRQARITRDAAGRYRFIESLLVRANPGGADSTPATPLRLVRLALADGVRGLGGDVGPGQLLYDAPYLTIADLVGPGEFQVVFTYVVSAGVKSVEMEAAAPLDELILEIQRGSVTARPDPRFVPDGEAGPQARPFRRYVARQLPAGAALSVEFVERRVDWRQRLAVSFGTAVAVALVVVWVWRRDAAARQAARRPADSEPVATEAPPL